jgi:hypothetical protein
MNCSGIPSIPSVLSGDYKEVIFLDAPQFRENSSICPMALPALVHWSNLANLPLSICFGKMSIINCPFFVFGQF